MTILISIDYRTSWGERLLLRAGESSYEMTYEAPGIWQTETDDIPCGCTYSFEVWREGSCVRKEWRGHVLPASEDSMLIVRDMWNDRPSDSPFRSSLFSDVIFARRTSGKSSVGNVTFRFASPCIGPDQTLAIAGSGEFLGDWQKMIPMDDSAFPEWNVSLKVVEAFEYKFVIVEKETLRPLCWEEGGNRYFSEIPQEGTSIVIADRSPSFHLKHWRGAGTAVPVFSLKSAGSFGTGEFRDIKKLVDWAVATGQSLIQLLPVNDTTMTGTWEDSYPYNANSTFALHPMFIHLPDAGVRPDKAYHSIQNELNSLKTVNYGRVMAEKTRLLREAFAREGEKILSGDAFKKFWTDNKDWLMPYAVFCCLRDENGTPDPGRWGGYAEYSDLKAETYAKTHPEGVGFYYYEQFCLDAQLKDAVAYAHSRGVGLKGDLPIGISRTSADAWVHPSLFHMDSQAGAPPDAFSAFGQNWGFPTYNWEKMSEDGFAWWKARMRKMGEYFDAFRIDHILGFFRIWEIPADSVRGLLGYFNPALPYPADYLRSIGFDAAAQSEPFMADWALDEIFGDLAGEVRSKYIAGGKLADCVSTQRKVKELFSGEDERTVKLREGLMSILEDVLFVEDPRSKGFYHPRIAASRTRSYRSMDSAQKETFDRLYEDFFYRRHNAFWKESAMGKLPPLIDSSQMLPCGEDLGMIPGCVADVMRGLNILSLEIQRMPKSFSEEFADPSRYPYLCVCATGTHDTSTLRAWWEEDPEATGRFYRGMLHCQGDAPSTCEPQICEKIVKTHLDSPAMLSVLPLQDWLSIDGDLRYQGDPADERINIPANPRHYWRYRMHLSLEDLLGSAAFNGHLRDIIGSSSRMPWK